MPDGIPGEHIPAAQRERMKADVRFRSAAGQTNTDIAAALKINRHTVRELLREALAGDAPSDISDPAERSAQFKLSRARKEMVMEAAWAFYDTAKSEMARQIALKNILEAVRGVDKMYGFEISAQTLVNEAGELAKWEHISEILNRPVQIEVATVPVEAIKEFEE